ncbi:MFS transporter [Streptomyces sp. NBC_01264]|uniref:MFS transporter n=1 Tax=Streptomyces sp. NBC_01264 TaxID=2903804 RepID=UPI00224CFB1D|nr:MFS transporter [Streptomyces sp. NBC_01264]MCX4775524.1 MFS transporter [Streptomyces sp. NBC_01264]
MPPSPTQPTLTTTTDAAEALAPEASGGRLPLAPLLALSMAAFITLLTEALPAGVLPEMARDLSVGEPAMGQAVTVYAIATGLAAIPLAKATAAWRRKRLLLSVGVFAVANTVTAISSNYPLTLAFRVLAGIAAAAVWAELVGYARRLAPPHLQGRAIAITLAGIPLALSLGIPLGTLLGGLIGWRPTFALVTLVALLLLGWTGVVVPDAPGQRPGSSQPVWKALRLPGVAAVLLVTAAYVLAHTILYTSIAAFLDVRGLSDSRESVLLVFGLASMAAVLVTGALVDRRLRVLTVTAMALFIAASVVLITSTGSLFAVYAAMVLWGLGWGGVATLLQTAVTDAGGGRGQALFVTVCNSSLAGGGAIGGVLLGNFCPASFPWTTLALLALALAVVIAARAHAFPTGRTAGPSPLTGG